MNILTKIVLKRTVSTLICVASLVFFGIITFSLFRFELTPDISMPMYVAYCIYPGAAPEDCDRLIAKEFEDKCSGLANVKKMTSMSAENLSGVILQYNYGTDMGKAYNDLKKAIDEVSSKFDSAIEKPVIVEMDINSMPSLRMVVENSRVTDLYNYVNNDFKPEMEKLGAASQVNLSGGRENYVSIVLSIEEMQKFGLSMDSLASIIAAADFSYPAGTIKVADRDLSVSTQVKYNTVEAFNKIPIITGNNNTIYLEDIAEVKYTKKDAKDVGRYDGKNTMIVSIVKKQSATAVELSNQVNKKIEQLTSMDPGLSVKVVEDNANNIMAALENVFQTMIIAIVLSMLIIFLFFGEMKASLIVGTSIPISILSALICMYLCKFSLNLITLSALVLGVGMMVDNSIVVLEACFRAKEELDKENKEDNILKFVKTTILATKNVGASIFGGTATTCVVFLPLAFLTGIAGQFFKPLGLTIVFCMVASFISALTIVPLCYVFIHPIEKEKAPLTKLITWVQGTYRNFIPKTLKHKWITFLVFMGFIALSVPLIPQLRTELVPAADESMIKVGINTKASMVLSKKDEIYKIIENYVKNDKNVEHYLIASDAGGAMSQNSKDEMTLIAYLKGKKDRDISTKDLVSKWKKDLNAIPDCTLDITSYSTSFTSTFVLDSNVYKQSLESSSYEELQKFDKRVVEALRKRPELIGVHSSLESTAPLVKVKVDPILAAAEGIAPAKVGAQVYEFVTGKKVMDKNINGEKLTFQLEYPENRFDTVDKIDQMIIKTDKGKRILLKDVATVVYADSPRMIQKTDKKYRSTIKANYAEGYTNEVDKILLEEVVKPNLSYEVTTAQQAYDEFLDEELKGLAYAVIIAIFLVFAVMAMQFESLKFSFMVMFTVLFSFVGSIFALWITDVSLSIPALLGVMMLIGTAVNNGILYVDTVNQLKDRLGMEKALVEAGAIRYRPILMTTLTTIIAEIPMACAYGRNGEILQGLALVNFGGLITSTITALYLLPALYLIFYGHERKTFYTGMKQSVDEGWDQIYSKNTNSDVVY